MFEAAIRVKSMYGKIVGPNWKPEKKENMEIKENLHKSTSKLV